MGVLDLQTADDSLSGARGSNFAVVRVKRDILRRSAVGVMLTRRSVSETGSGSNDAMGVDGTFAFYDNLTVDTFLARTRSAGRSGDDQSYRAQVAYEGDRYGITAERLAVGANFNPEIGFIRRDDFRRNFGKVRFSPRPSSLALVRRFAWEASHDSLTDGAGRLETRRIIGQFRTEFDNSDIVAVEYAQNYEHLDRPFRLTPHTSVPPGSYDFNDLRLSYQLGTQRRASGSFRYEQGTFYNGTKRGISYSSARIEVMPQLWLEPSLSWNWIDLPGTTVQRHVLSTRATYSLTPRVFVAALVQYGSANASVGTNVRFRWEYRPGSEVFLVYSDGRNVQGPSPSVLQNRGVLVKLNRLFRF